MVLCSVLPLIITTSLWCPKILFPTPLRSPATLRLISGTCYNIWDNWFSWQEYKGTSPWPTEMRSCTLSSLCRLENLRDACNYQLFTFLYLNSVRRHKIMCFINVKTKSLRTHPFSQGHRLVGFRAKSWTSLPSPLLVTTTQNCLDWASGYHTEGQVW